MEERTKLFSNDTLKNGLPLESETDLLLKKMERMRKVKNNYKNIDVLDNIYDTESGGSSGFFDGIQRFFKNINDIQEELAQIEGFDGDDSQEGFDGDDSQEGFDGDDSQEGFDGDDSQEGFDDDSQEGFDDDSQEGFDGDDSQEGFDDDSQEGFDGDDSQEGFDGDDSQEGFDDDSQEGFDNNELYSKQYEDKYTPYDVKKTANINTANLRRQDGVRYYGPRGSLTNPSDDSIFKKIGRAFKKMHQNTRARQNRINRRGREKRDRINRRGREKRDRIRRRRKEKRARIRRRGREKRDRIRRRRKDRNKKKAVSEKLNMPFLSRIMQLIKRILAFNPQRFIRDKIATRVYKYTSGNDPKSNKDIDIITKQIIMLIYGLIAVFISGNWYYIMFYKDANGIPNSSKFNGMIDTIVEKGGPLFRYLRLDSQLQPLWLTNVFLCNVTEFIITTGYGYFEFFAYYLSLMFIFNRIFPREYDVIRSSYKTIISNKQLLFILFTFFIIYCILKYSSSLYKAYQTYKNPKTKKLPKTSSTIIKMIIVFNLLFGVKTIVSPLLKGAGIKYDDSKGMIGNALGLFKSILYFLALGPILYIIIFFIALAVNIMIMRISGLFVIVYLYIYAYFGAMLRGDSKTALSDFFKNVGKYNPCESSTSNAFTRLMTSAISFIYANLTSMIIVCFSIWSILVYKFTISNQRSAAALIGANMVIIAIAIVASMINSYTSKNKVNLQDYNYIEPYNK